MIRFKTTMLMALLSLWCMAAYAQEMSEAEKPARVGIGLNLGVQKPYCDVLHTGFAPAGEVMFRFLLNDRINLSTGLGYGLLSDGFSNYTFQTNLISGDLKLNLNLSKPGKVNPYVYIGAGVINFEYKPNKSWALGNPGLAGRRFYDGVFLGGGGMEIMISPKFALNAFAEYRQSTGDALDGAEVGESVDGYMNARAGFTYYFGKKGSGKIKSDDELLALQFSEMGEASPEMKMKNNEKLASFDAKLDKLDKGDSEITMEQYVRLKSRVDELNGLIDGKETELNDLRATLDFKNQRIADLESSLGRSGGSAGAGISSGNFSSNYENALRNFYARDYSNAIRIFQDLKVQFPNHQLTSNCQYWIGESYFGMTDYTRAAEAFQAVFNYGSALKKDDATLMLGRCYMNLNDTAKARSYFQGVINDYPDSEYLEKAKQWLSRIG